MASAVAYSVVSSLRRPWLATRTETWRPRAILLCLRSRKVAQQRSADLRTCPLGKLCTGGRAGADGWVTHESARVDAGVGLIVAACEGRGVVLSRPAGFT